MRVFMTGATGFIGLAIVPELIEAGHQILGLARSDAAEQSLAKAGAEVHQGSLEDLDGLRRGAARSDGVIHCAFNNDFSQFKESNEKEVKAIEAMGRELAGSDRPLVITSVAAMGTAAPGQLATEDYFDPGQPKPRNATEVAGAAAAKLGVSVSVVRLPQVHSIIKQGFVTVLMNMARAKGVSAYVGEGANRWAAAHVLDVAHLYRLALERNQAGSRYNAVAEEGVALRLIAETIAEGLGVAAVSLLPQEAQAHFGPFAMFAAADMAASGEKTQRVLGWRPSGPGLIQDLQQLHGRKACD